jgi:PKD domain
MVSAAAPWAGAQSNWMNPDNGMTGMEQPSPPPDSSASAAELPPLPGVMIRQPILGTMTVTRGYGKAPLTTGFFVMAHDPENIGFLTYRWDFGDGSVSALPPEMYIPHTYKQPGNYVCTLTLTTADGRSKTLFAGVTVKPSAD